jgi:hypothetical protein
MGRREGRVPSAPAVVRNAGSGSASSYGCKVSVITSPDGIVTQLDTEDYNPRGTGLIGLAGALGAYGSMKLGMKPQS